MDSISEVPLIWRGPGRDITEATGFVYENYRLFGQNGESYLVAPGGYIWVKEGVVSPTRKGLLKAIEGYYNEFIQEVLNNGHISGIICEVEPGKYVLKDYWFEESPPMAGINDIYPEDNLKWLEAGTKIYYEALQKYQWKR